MLVFDADAKRVLLHALSLRARVPGLSVAPAWQSAQEQRHHPPARSLMDWSLGRARGGEGGTIISLTTFRMRRIGATKSIPNMRVDRTFVFWRSRSEEPASPPACASSPWGFSSPAAFSDAMDFVAAAPSPSSSWLRLCAMKILRARSSCRLVEIPKRMKISARSRSIRCSSSTNCSGDRHTKLPCRRPPCSGALPAVPFTQWTV